LERLPPEPGPLTGQLPSPWRKIMTLSKLIGNGAEAAVSGESGLRKDCLLGRQQLLQPGQ